MFFIEAVKEYVTLEAKIALCTELCFPSGLLCLLLPSYCLGVLLAPAAPLKHPTDPTFAATVVQIRRASLLALFRARFVRRTRLATRIGLLGGVGNQGDIEWHGAQVRTRRREGGTAAQTAVVLERSFQGRSSRHSSHESRSSPPHTASWQCSIECTLLPHPSRWSKGNGAERRRPRRQCRARRCT